MHDVLVSECYSDEINVAYFTIWPWALYFTPFLMI